MRKERVRIQPPSAWGQPFMRCFTYSAGGGPGSKWPKEPKRLALVRQRLSGRLQPCREALREEEGVTSVLRQKAAGFQGDGGAGMQVELHLQVRPVR